MESRTIVFLGLLSVASLPLAPRSRIASLRREETAWDWRSLDCSAILFDATLLHAGKYLKPRESGIESLCDGLRDALRDAFPYDAFKYDAFPYDAFVYDTFPYDAFLYDAFPYDAFPYINAFRL